MNPYVYLALILFAIMLGSTATKASTEKVSGPAEKSYEEAVKQQEALQRLKWQVEAFETRAKEYRAKADIARALNEALKTGLVDTDGNLTGKEAMPTFSSSSSATGAETAHGMPVLNSVQGQYAYFTTSQGLLPVKVGGILPGNYTVKSIKQGNVMLMRDGKEYMTKINWTKPKEKKLEGEVPPAAVNPLDFLQFPSISLGDNDKNGSNKPRVEGVVGE